MEHWRELNSAADFLQVMFSVDKMVTSLAQLIHHKDKILATLLGALHKNALLSLEPICDLIATLARDLQGNYSSSKTLAKQFCAHTLFIQL